MNEIFPEQVYGYAELRSWFEFDGEKLIGMGSKKRFDRQGNLIDYEESPTGITLTWETQNMAIPDYDSLFVPELWGKSILKHYQEQEAIAFEHRFPRPAVKITRWMKVKSCFKEIRCRWKAIIRIVRGKQDCSSCDE